MKVIDIDPALDEIDDIVDYDDEYGLGYTAGINRVINILDKQPELKVTASWTFTGSDFICSNCKSSQLETVKTFIRTKYCPNCGAWMDNL